MNKMLDIPVKKYFQNTALHSTKHRRKDIEARLKKARNFRDAEEPMLISDHDKILYIDNF